MKLIDGLLKYLKTDRNTFFTYIFTLVTIYLAIDRVVEILFMIFTGLSVDYWGPIQYTFALACPVLAFCFSGPSKFVKNDETKISFFYLYCIALYIIGISMLAQWVNYAGWLLFISVPNYSYIVDTLPELIAPAFKSLTIYIPIVTVPMLFRFLYEQVNESSDLKDSILDFGGINLSPSKDGTGIYTCETKICTDVNTSKSVIIPEIRRYELALVVGSSGSGKTSMIFEPMIAGDIEKKSFFRSVAKEMGFTALKNGTAMLNCPYTNDYLNENFDLNMIEANSYKENVYKAYMKNLIQDNSSGSTIVYKNLGITYISPDFESISHMLSVANNYNFKVNLIDPNNLNSLGLNPFVYDDPNKIAIIVSSVISNMYKSFTVKSDDAYREKVAIQAIENLSIMLKEMYPRLNNGDLPTLEDLLKMLNDFDLVEKMCKQMMNEPELAERYSVQIAYFKKHFFEKAIARNETERNVQLAITQLDNLLRYPGIKNILCNRGDNINFDEALSQGQITLLCTRRGDLGEKAHKAFGLFFILLMQHSILSRPGNERSRIPHFLYIDEFADYICKSTEAIFTMYRKYRVGTVISVQNIEQLNSKNSEDQYDYKKVILANSGTKILFGGNTPEDNEWWEKEFGNKRQWQYSQSYDTNSGKYDAKLGGIKYGWTANANAGKIQTLKFKNCVYKTKNISGGVVVGFGKLDFLDNKYKQSHKEKTYKFDKYNSSATTSADVENEELERKRKFKRKTKFDFSNVNFEDDNGEIDPIKTNTDGAAFFNNEDAISFNFKKNEEDQ